MSSCLFNCQLFLVQRDFMCLSCHVLRYCAYFLSSPLFRIVYIPDLFHQNRWPKSGDLRWENVYRWEAMFVFKTILRKCANLIGALGFPFLIQTIATGLVRYMKKSVRHEHGFPMCGNKRIFHTDRVLLYLLWEGSAVEWCHQNCRQW